MKKGNATCCIMITQMRLFSHQDIYVLLSCEDRQKQRSTIISTNDRREGITPILINESFVFRFSSLSHWKVNLELCNSDGGLLLACGEIDIDEHMSSSRDMDTLVTLHDKENKDSICYLDIQISVSLEKEEKVLSDDTSNIITMDKFLLFLESSGWLLWLLFVIGVLYLTTSMWTSPSWSHLPVGKMHLTDGMSIFQGERVGMCVGFSSSRCSPVFLHMHESGSLQLYREEQQTTMTSSTNGQQRQMLWSQTWKDIDKDNNKSWPHLLRSIIFKDNKQWRALIVRKLTTKTEIIIFHGDELVDNLDVMKQDELVPFFR